MQKIRKLLDSLFVADPETAQEVLDILDKKVPHDWIKKLAADGTKGLFLESAFGRAFCIGMAGLAHGDQKKFDLYRKLVSAAGREGATLGKIMADNLALALKSPKPGLSPKLISAVYSTRKWGVHALPRPLNEFARLLEINDLDSAAKYLGLVRAVFSQNMTYHQRLLFSRLLPKASKNLSEQRRCFQLEAMIRVARVNLACVEPFYDGLKKGTSLLDKVSLEKFVDQGLARLSRSRDAAMKFFSMESRLGAEAFSNLQVMVSLARISPPITKYIRARTGKNIQVRSISTLLFSGIPKAALSASDGKNVYLPEELGVFETKQENTALYKALARLEAGLCEFDTHDFDLAKAVFACRKAGISISLPKTKPKLTDFALFFSEFDLPMLAKDLFVVFEHARVNRLLIEKYPGFLRHTFPIMKAEAARILSPDSSPTSFLYARLALGMDCPGIGGDIQKILDLTCLTFKSLMQKNSDVHQSAVFVAKTYADWAAFLQKISSKMLIKDLARIYQPMQTPFGRTIITRATAKNAQADRKTAMLMAKLSSMGVYVFRSDLKKCMESQSMAVTEQDIRDLAMPMPGPEDTCEEKFDKDQRRLLDLSELLDSGDLALPVLEQEPVKDPVFWYKEWDHYSQDYMPGFCRVVAGACPASLADFYDSAMKTHQGLVKNIRKSFEFIKPQGLVILRRWIEGDAFDHRALIDYAVDRKSKRTPSERLYIKRVKQVRDVAVLLLVDLSRSTANPAAGSDKSVLTVEKEAIVLFCEALAAVGDAFAIAGFSGAGRLRVDYLKIKDFDEPFNHKVKQRISGMAPARNTRMGPAIRHATHVLSLMPSKVRLLIILSDGFPNDLEYKGRYSIEDTRYAIAEARAKQIHAHAITVNMQEAIQLDRIYGGVHHSLISDVAELPHKLPRIYRTLTR